MNENCWDVPSIAVDALKNWLEINISGLTCYDEWPYGNQQLKYPAITIFTGQATRMPLMPEVDSVTEPDVNNKVIANEVVAEYDFNLQLDLWCKNKLERKQTLAKLLTAFNGQESDTSGANNPDGLTLVVPNYFNMPVRFEIQNHKHKDDEQAAQRQERRELISVIVNCREIRQRTYYAMKQIQSVVGSGSTDDQTSDTETNDV